MATYLGRNVNLALLVIIIGVVVALVGVTVYFQRALQDKSNEGAGLNISLGQCMQERTNLIDKYSQAEQTVNRTSADIRRYDQLYEQKSVELKDAQAILTDTQKELASEKFYREQFKRLYEAASKDVTSLNQTLSAQRSQITSLGDKLDACEEEVNDYEACVENAGISC